MKSRIGCIASLALILAPPLLLADQQVKFTFICNKKSTNTCTIGVDRLVAKDVGYTAVPSAKEHGKVVLNLNAISYNSYNGAKAAIGAGITIGAIAAVAGVSIAAAAALTTSTTTIGAAYNAAGVAGTVLPTIGTGGVTNVIGGGIAAGATNSIITVGSTVISGSTASIISGLQAIGTSGIIASAIAAAAAAGTAAVTTYNVSGRAGGVYLVDPSTGKASSKLDESCQKIFYKKPFMLGEADWLQNGNPNELYLLPHGAVLEVTVTSTPDGYKNCMLYD